jgi:hypothetical protein
MTRNKILTTILFLTVFLSLSAQEDRFKEFAESHKDRAFCFYPSTLRMLNIGDQQEFNNLVNNVEKLLVYKLDSISGADKLYSNMIEDYKSDGFEEYVKIEGGGNDMLILGSPAGAEKEFVGIVIDDEISLAFFLRGEVGWEEIPKMISSFQNGDFINVLDLNLAEFD